jgi:hypothetical protein
MNPLRDSALSALLSNMNYYIGQKILIKNSGDWTSLSGIVERVQTLDKWGQIGAASSTGEPRSRDQQRTLNFIQRISSWSTSAATLSVANSSQVLPVDQSHLAKQRPA